MTTLDTTAVIDALRKLPEADLPKVIETAQALLASREFKMGEHVAFHAKGRAIVAQITAINRVKVECTEVSPIAGKKWRVPLTMLVRATPPAPAPAAPVAAKPVPPAPFDPEAALEAILASTKKPASGDVKPVAPPVTFSDTPTEEDSGEF